MILTKNSDDVECVEANEDKTHCQINISANRDAVQDDEDAAEQEAGVANEEALVHMDLLWRINDDATTDHCKDKKGRAEEHCDTHLCTFRLSSWHGR